MHFISDAQPLELGSQSKVNPINPNVRMNESIFECVYSACNFVEHVEREFGSHFNGTQMKFYRARCADEEKVPEGKMRLGIPVVAH